MKSNNRPAHEIKIGSIRASIWKNETGHRDTWFNVSITRLYKDGDTWKSSASFGRDDLPLVAKAADMAYAWIWNTKGERHVAS